MRTVTAGHPGSVTPGLRLLAQGVGALRRLAAVSPSLAVHTNEQADSRKNREWTYHVGRRWLQARNGWLYGEGHGLRPGIGPKVLPEAYA